jgi:hypothetical protein
MKTVKVHSSNSIRFTDHAKYWCETINKHKRVFPEHTFKQIAKCYDLSETNVRRYYYGVHHVNGQIVQWARGYTQIRRGACVSI